MAGRHWTVYLLREALNGKGYVGITSAGAEVRFGRHLADTGRIFASGRRGALGAALAKIPAEHWTISILAETDDLDEAAFLEGHYVRKLDTYASGPGPRNGYNMTMGGDLPRLPRDEYERHIAERLRRLRLWRALRERLAAHGDLPDFARYEGECLAVLSALSVLDKGLLADTDLPEHADLLDRVYDRDPAFFERLRGAPRAPKPLPLAQRSGGTRIPGQQVRRVMTSWLSYLKWERLNRNVPHRYIRDAASGKVFLLW